MVSQQDVGGQASSSGGPEHPQASSAHAHPVLHCRPEHREEGIHQINRVFVLVHIQCFTVGLNTGKKGYIRSTGCSCLCTSTASL